MPPPKVHPGEVLLEEYLKPLNLKQAELAVRLGVPASRINDVVKQRRGLTADLAIRLARVLGPHETFWSRLQGAYDAACAYEANAHAYDTLQRMTLAEAAA